MLRQLRSIRRSVSDPVLQSLFVALVMTKLDGSATLAGLPAVQLDRLQSVLNAAAWLIYRRRKFDHVSPLLKELHWLRACECPSVSPSGWQFLLTDVSTTWRRVISPPSSNRRATLVTGSVYVVVVVGHARCSSHRTRDHRWQCVQFNCSSCVEQFANGRAVF